MKRSLILFSFLLIYSTLFSQNQANYTALFNKNIDVCQQQGALSFLSGAEVDIDTTASGYIYSYKSAGVSITTNENNLIQEIRFFSDDPGFLFKGYKGFQGKLPGNIDMNDTRGTVEKKIGKANNTSQKAALGFNYVSVYPHLGLEIKFTSTDQADKEAKIEYIKLIPGK